MRYELAIIIPAYKPDYLEQTLRSVAGQSDRRFNLYLFDDASPHDLQSAVKKSGLSELIRYHRFEQNLGQKSLPAHWGRCVEKTEGEKWIWLFSDDDLMDPDCVKQFYKSLEQHGGYPCYRFTTLKVDENGNRIRENRFPEMMSASMFLNLKLSYEVESYIVESIFSREVYEKTGGFPDLPLAWGTDDLFWVKVALNGGIRSIPHAKVKWRYSSVNISGGKHRGSALKKLEASRALIRWIAAEKNLSEQLEPKDLTSYWYARQLRSLEKQLSFFDELGALAKVIASHPGVVKHYLKMKKERSKLIGWLKKYLS